VGSEDGLAGRALVQPGENGLRSANRQAGSRRMDGDSFIFGRGDLRSDRRSAVANACAVRADAAGIDAAWRASDRAVVRRRRTGTEPQWDIRVGEILSERGDDEYPQKKSHDNDSEPGPCHRAASLSLTWSMERSES
jgi:hypothetical protein